MPGGCRGRGSGFAILGEVPQPAIGRRDSGASLEQPEPVVSAELPAVHFGDDDRIALQRRTGANHLRPPETGSVAVQQGLAIDLRPPRKRCVADAAAGFAGLVPCQSLRQLRLVALAFGGLLGGRGTTGKGKNGNCNCCRNVGSMAHVAFLSATPTHQPRKPSFARRSSPSSSTDAARRNGFVARSWPMVLGTVGFPAARSRSTSAMRATIAALSGSATSA